MILFHKVRFLCLTNVLCTATLSVLRTEQIQFGICKEGKDDIRISQISLGQCMQNCLDRNECFSLNFQRKVLLCRLHTESSTLCNCKTTGFIYSAKISWDKVCISDMLITWSSLVNDLTKSIIKTSVNLYLHTVLPTWTPGSGHISRVMGHGSSITYKRIFVQDSLYFIMAHRDPESTLCKNDR